MEIILAYAISWCGLFILYVFGGFTIRHRKLVKTKCFQIARLFAHRNLIGRHRLFGPVSISSLVAYSTYIGINTFCLVFRVATIQDLAIRAGNMCILNLLPLVLVFPLADWFKFFGVSLKTGLRIHFAGAYMCCGLITCHIVIIMVNDNSISLSKNIYTTSVCLMLPLS